jgi:excisionase family DNA binding protein
MKIRIMQDVILSQIPLQDLKAEIAEAVRATLIPVINAAINPPQDDGFLTRVQTAKLLGVSCPTLLDWTRKGRVPGHRIGKFIRYKRSEVESSLKAIKTGR